MKRIFHIGYHKTASTFLQESFFGANKIFYQVPRDEVQARLLDVGSLQYSPTEAQTWYEKHLESACDNGSAYLVISEEELSGNIHTGGNGGYLAKEVSERLYRLDKSAYVLIVVRNQIDIIESAYRQYVKRGGTFGIGRYLRPEHSRCHRFPQFQFEHFEYHALVSHYQNLFGQRQVITIPYEELHSALEHILLHRLDDEHGFASLKENPMGSRRYNPSYSFFSIWIARILNHFYGGDPINQRVIVNIPYLYPVMRRSFGMIDKTPALRRMDTKYRFLSKNMRAYIRDRYRYSNRELMELTNLDLSRLGYPT